MSRFGRLFPVLLLASAALPTVAEARAVCEELRQELSMNTGNISSTRESRRFTRTVNQLNRDIRQLRSDLRRAGCTGGSIVYFGDDNDDFCRITEEDLHQAETAKREMLQRRLDLDAGARGEILAAMRRNGCMEAEGQEPEPMEDIVASRDAEQEGYGIRDFGAIDRQPQDMLPLDGQTLDAMPQQQGAFRTICVRTCDGGFFPISSNATPANFESDAATCAKMCPGTQTELYYHSMTDQETSDMVSASTGAPYTALPTAFAYRNRKDTKNSSCSCDLNSYYRDALKKEKGGAPVPAQKPEPQPRQAAKQPQTVPAEQAGKATSPEAGTSGKITLEERPYDPSKLKIRQVGPQFLGDDSAGIDLKNPKGSPVQPLQ